MSDGERLIRGLIAQANAARDAVVLETEALTVWDADKVAVLVTADLPLTPLLASVERLVAANAQLALAVRLYCAELRSP